MGATDDTRTATTFSSSSTRSILLAACAHVGLSSDGAELLRLGENALYRLASAPVVVRIARTMDYWDDAAKEVAVSHWLKEHDFPAARACDVSQPVAVDGHPVTFWRYIEGRTGTRADVATLGRLLRRLHATPAPSTFQLPAEDVLGRVRPRIEVAPVPASDKRFLLERWRELSQAVLELDFPMAPAPTHGDPHIKNIMVSNGSTVLIDFERFAWGQPEWDLSLTATEYRTAGWWTDAEYATFASAYGYDITTWSGFDVLRAVHEIKMTTWLMQNIHESPEIEDEYRVRMRTIRTGQADRPWRPF